MQPQLDGISNSEGVIEVADAGEGGLAEKPHDIAACNICTIGERSAVVDTGEEGKGEVEGHGKCQGGGGGGRLARS